MRTSGGGPASSTPRTSDPRNFCPLTTKAIVDGLVDAGVLVPDDGPEWVQEGDPVIWQPRHPVVVVRVEAAPLHVWRPGEH